jgi:hypothetical protein
MKIHPVGAEFFRADKQAAARDEGNSHFSQFREATQKLPVGI